MSRTLVICKPDAVERRLTGEILRRLEAKRLRLVAVELRTIDDETARGHYAEHESRSFFSDLVTFITGGPSLLVVVEGPGDDTWEVVRTLIGPTDPAKAPPGTIRGDLGLEVTENVAHGSDSRQSAEREIALFFPSLT